MESHFSVKTGATTAVNLNRYRMSGRTLILAKDKVIPRPEFLEGRERVGGHAGANQGLRRLLAQRRRELGDAESESEEEEDDISSFMPKFSLTSLLRQWKFRALRSTQREKSKFQIATGVSPRSSPALENIESMHDAVSMATSEKMGLHGFAEGKKRAWADPLLLKLEQWFIKGDDESWFTEKGFVPLVAHSRRTGSERGQTKYAESDEILRPQIPQTEGFRPTPDEVDMLVADVIHAVRELKCIRTLSFNVLPLVSFPPATDKSVAQKMANSSSNEDDAGSALVGRFGAREAHARELIRAEQSINFHPRHYARLYCILFRGVSETLSRLGSLTLTQCDLTDGAVLIIADWLQGVQDSGDPQLHRLDLSNNLIGSLGAEALATTLKNSHAKLEELSLHGNPLGDAGEFAICEILTGALSLRVLDLGFCRFGNDISKMLFKAIGITHLHHLSLEGMRMSSQASLLLLGAVTHNKSLTSMNLRFNQTCSSKQFQERLNVCFTRNEYFLHNHSSVAPGGTSNSSGPTRGDLTSFNELMGSLVKNKMSSAAAVALKEAHALPTGYQKYTNNEPSKPRPLALPGDMSRHTSMSSMAGLSSRGPVGEGQVSLPKLPRSAR